VDRDSNPWCRLAGACALAAFAPLAAAQEPELFPPVTWSSGLHPLLLQESGKVLEKPQDDQGQPRDVFQVKPVEVRPGALKEEAPVGEYDQPLWTTFRRFPSTRVYLQTPPGGVQFEQWVQLRNPKDGNAETRLAQELEFGLGHRMQLDLYLNELHVRDGVNSTYEFSGTSFELRYALADWDRIWGNPTIYLEYLFNDQNHDGADGIEPKLLFGGEITTGWHWGANFAHERTFAGHNDSIAETSFFGSVSRTIVDQAFSLGVSTEVTYESSGAGVGQPRNHEFSWLAGPSLQFLPHPRASIDIEPLWGLTSDSLKTKIYIIFSWHF
jgi:hypothetical protein